MLNELTPQKYILDDLVIVDSHYQMKTFSILTLSVFSYFLTKDVV